MYGIFLVPETPSYVLILSSKKAAMVCTYSERPGHHVPECRRRVRYALRHVDHSSGSGGRGPAGALLPSTPAVLMMGPSGPRAVGDRRTYTERLSFFFFFGFGREEVSGGPKRGGRKRRKSKEVAKEVWNDPTASFQIWLSRMRLITT